jgi:O-antigen ligase
MSTIEIAAGTPPRDRLELIGLGSLMLFVAALQLSIAAAQILLTVALLCWAGTHILHRERVRVPPFFWPLAAYAGLTLVSTAFSRDPLVSLVDSKQLLLFLVVPAVYHLARGERANTLVQVIITAGAAAATFGIIQYAILHYDHLGQRPQGTLGHYMTYSGLLMLVTVAAVATVLFGRRNRIWPALVMPALLVALALTFTRNAWIGTGLALALLLAIRNARLLWIMPVVAVLFLALGPQGVTNRFYSIFDANDPANRDRLAMLHAGTAIVKDEPLTGVGPNMVERVYPEYRAAWAVEPVNPHLHNVPVQIAAERGLPALAAWLWFVGMVSFQLFRKLKTARCIALPAAGLAAVVAMLGAGLFEHNFGDSEFLMLFLVLITLPYAAERGEQARRSNAVPGAAPAAAST